MSGLARQRYDYGMTWTSAETDVNPPVEPESGNAVTVGPHKQAAMYNAVIAARAAASQDDWDGDGAVALSQGTVAAAIRLVLSLPNDFPIPVVTPDSAGEVIFEWYKDRHHVAVIGVDGQFLRWSAIAEGYPPIAGCAPFLRAIPARALEAVTTVVG